MGQKSFIFLNVLCINVADLVKQKKKSKNAIFQGTKDHAIPYTEYSYYKNNIIKDIIKKDKLSLLNWEDKKLQKQLSQKIF